MEDLLHRGLIVKESCLDIENRKQLFSYRASICFLNIDCSVYYPPPISLSLSLSLSITDQQLCPNLTFIFNIYVAKRDRSNLSILSIYH